MRNHHINIGMQQTLYGLGGTYFNKADYHRSKIIDMQFLKIWPNHLDVLFRVAYANNKLGNNDNALKLAKRLQQIETLFSNPLALPMAICHFFIFVIFRKPEVKK